MLGAGADDVDRVRTAIALTRHAAADDLDGGRSLVEPYLSGCCQAVDPALVGSLLAVNRWLVDQLAGELQQPVAEILDAALLHLASR